MKNNHNDYLDMCRDIVTAQKIIMKLEIKGKLWIMNYYYLTVSK